MATAEGFEEFVHATGQRLLTTALLSCAHPRPASDLAQATYATVFARWRRVRLARDPVAATRTIMTRACLSEPGSARCAETPVVSVAGATSTGDASPRPTLLDALARLSAHDRAVLVLRYWEGQAPTDTAADLAIGATACHTRTARALGRLRTHRPDLDTEAQLRACMDAAVAGATVDLHQLVRESRREGMRLRRYRYALSTVGVAAVGSARGAC